MSLKVDGMNGLKPDIKQKRSKVDQVNLFRDTSGPSDLKYGISAVSREFHDLGGIAAAAMSFSSVSVISNSLRLRKLHL